MCEMRGIDRIRPWRSPGWAHFGMFEPWQLWASPNSTPPEFEQKLGRQKLQQLWRKAPPATQADRQLCHHQQR